MMITTIHEQLVAGLLLWAIGSMGSALIGLYAGPRAFWRAFWFMSGIWGLVDGLIGWFALIGEPPAASDLVWLLKFNSGLDVIYVLVGVILFSRTTPLLRGFGLAVLVQGVFLLVFDLSFWWRCAGLAE